MNAVIAIPVFRIGCKVGLDKGRPWSVVDELLLWAVRAEPKTIASLAEGANLPHQLVVASIARLMRFRLVEVVVSDTGVAFKASSYGFESINSVNPLPFFPKRISRRVSFVIEWATGDFFLTRQIRLVAAAKLEELRRNGVEVRVVTVDGGGPSMSHEANLNRLSDVATRGLDEHIALVDGRTATMRDDEFMLLRVIDGAAQGLPQNTGPTLRAIVDAAARLPAGTTDFQVTYAGPQEENSRGNLITHACQFEATDVIVGGSAQRDCLDRLLANAHRRVIIHSTFLDAQRFDEFKSLVQAACRRGVTFDLLWGAEKDEETAVRNSLAASRIAQAVREDPILRGRFRIHLRTTGSHAKIILADSLNDGWVAGIGSCNWLSSPFQAVELSVLLRDQHVVADVASALQRLTDRRGLADDLATEMAITARDLRRSPKRSGDAQVSLVVGDAHEGLLRHASGTAVRRLVIGSNRLGSTARPGALLQGEVAAKRAGFQSTVLYTLPSGPLKNRHVQAIQEEAKSNGVTVVKTKKIPLHGKFALWDDDDLVVTSLNWASASVDPDFPLGEVGVHVSLQGIAIATLEKLEAIFPMLIANEQDKDGHQLPSSNASEDKEIG